MPILAANPSPRRYAMNPNRLLSDILAQFERQLYREQVHIEVRQSLKGVLSLPRAEAEAALNALFSRIVVVARPGSTLRLNWSLQASKLRLDIALSPPALRSALRLALPLLPSSSPMRARLDAAGIGFSAVSNDGPWALTFDALEI